MESSSQMIEARIRDLYWKNKHPISRYFEGKKNFIVEDRDVDLQISNVKTNIFFQNFSAWVFASVGLVLFFLQVSELFEVQDIYQMIILCSVFVSSFYINSPKLDRLEEIKHLKELLKVLKKEEEEKLEKFELVLN